MSRSGRKARVRWSWIAFCSVAPIFLLLAGMTLAYPIAAGALQKAGVIRYTRGKVTVLDRAALEDAACDCYEIISRRAAELLGHGD